ncbi:hypothetical protein H0H81_009501 [Sphagnurus paluster]|uniref:Uncharacterized protein n=1 Tax=Sphagnurus paluster TaxID=117069 RepID=A0A9P7KL78_9AGAR|nr:hypothetical protein H0H81_009501 [Sphagnurus paluster]
MAPYYGPEEDAATIFLERTFLAGDFICGVGYGGFPSIFSGSKSQFLITFSGIQLVLYTVFLLVIESIFEGVQTRTVELMYVDNRNYPGGPWEYFLATQNLPINVMFISCIFTLTFLADLLVMWRCWVIWGTSGKHVAYTVIAFPSTILLASFGAKDSNTPRVSSKSTLN